MKRRILKYLCTILTVFVFVSNMSINSFSAKPDNSTNKTAKRVLVKYKNNVKNTAEKVQKKKKDKKVKEYKETRNNNVYIIDIESDNYDELLLDTDIELVEEDASVQIMGSDYYEEQNEAHPVHDCSCCNSCENNHCTCSENCYYEPGCNSESCIDNHCLQDTDDDCTDGLNNIETIDFSEEPLKDGPFNMEGIKLETGTSGKQNTVGDKLPWNITRIQADKLHDIGITGSGVKVAVFDSGIDLGNPDLNVVGGISFVDGVTSYDDDNGHGTAMAGILAASLNGNGLVGVAPNIELYSVKVLDSNGMGRYSSVLQAVDWAIENNIKIITMSFGGNQYSQILAEAIKRASDNNIMIFSASGNAGSDSVYYPAAFSQVVCVGSTDSNNGIAAFSNHGEQMDLVAPGVEIETLGMNNINTYVDGTSASVQHAAGIAALLFGVNNSLTNGQVKFLLYYNAYVLGEIEIFGHGLVDAKKAYENLLSGKYFIPIIDENGEEIIIPGQVGIGEDGIIIAQSVCPCVGCYKGSSYYNYTEHSNGGHRRVYYCGLSSCRSKHMYTCIYPTSTYDQFTNCCQCKGHSYDNNCDTSCNRCESPRNISHTYSNSCDTLCNICGDERDITHTYSNNCDNTCNICSTTRTPPHSSISWDSGHSSYHYSGPEGSGHIKWGRCSSCGFNLSFTIESDSSCCQCGNHSWSTTQNHICRGSYDEYMVYCTRTGCSASESRETHTCNCHSCSYTTKVYGSHTSTGHDVYMSCSCGSQSYKGYKEANPNCLSCVTPPTASFVNIGSNTVLSQTHTTFYPTINVQDNENDTLTCKYFIDEVLVGTETVNGTSSTKLVTFSNSFDASALSDGTHTAKVQVNDSIAPARIISVAFKVDKTEPLILSTSTETSYNGVDFTVYASDQVSGLHSYAYKYIMPTISETEWLNSSNYSITDILEPATEYEYQILVRDNMDHIANYNGVFHTKAANPSITVQAVSSDSIKVSITDNNPALTEYQIMVGSLYANSSGVLTSNLDWIDISQKELIVTGLSADTSYNILIKARNQTGNESESASASTMTWPLPPSVPNNLQLIYVDQLSATLTWSPIPVASQYNIKKTVVVTQETFYFTNVSSPFMDSDLEAGFEYLYYVQAENISGNNGWSNPISVITIPNPPEQVSNISFQLTEGAIEFIWPETPTADYYSIQLNGVMQENTEEPSYTVAYSKYNYQYNLTVKAHNAGGCSQEWSIPCVAYTPAKTPCDININNINTFSFDISWQPNGNPENVMYQVGVFDETGNLVKENSYTYNLEDFILGLEPDARYTVKVKAINIDGLNTEYSDGIVINTLPEIPISPQNIRAIVKDTNINLYWDVVPYADTYSVKRNGEIIAENVTVAYYTDTALSPETTYTYSICAINEIGSSAWTYDFTKTTLSAFPETPQQITAEEQNTYVSITWNDVENAGGYELLVDGKIVNTGTETSYIHNGLLPGSWHLYQVRARNSSGKSDWSNEIWIQTIPGIPTVPDGIEGFSTDVQAIITWNSSEGAESYNLEINETVYTGIINSTYTITDLTPETEYNFRIQAVNRGGSSEWSSLHSVTTQAASSNAPIIQYTSYLSEILINWSTTSDAIGYELEADGLSIFFDSETTIYVHEGLNSAEEHTYRIRTLYGEESPGEWSILYKAATLPYTPIIEIDAAGKSFISISWNGVPGATYYQIEADGVIQYTGSLLQWNHTFLEPASNHSYRIRVGNTGGVSEWSDAITTSTRSEVDDCPKILFSLTQMEYAVILFTPIEGAVSYISEVNGQIYKYCFFDEGTYGDTNCIFACIFTIPDQNYSVKFAPVFDNNVIGEWSDSISFITAYSIPSTTYFNNYTQNNNSIALQWQYREGATSYEIEKNEEVFDVGDTNTYTDTGLDSGTTYQYRIRACNPAGKSEWSEALALTINTTTPGAISGFFSSYQSTEEGPAINLKWKTLSDAAYYEIQLDENEILSTGTATNSFVVNGLDYGTFYTFRIRSVNIEGIAGPWSTPIRCQTILQPPEITGCFVDESSIEIAWSEVPLATSYEVVMDGIPLGETELTSMTVSGSSRYLEHIFEVRAKSENSFGEWAKFYYEPQEYFIEFDVTEGEEFSLIISAANLDKEYFQYTVALNLNEVELLDVCEFTSEQEIWYSGLPGPTPIYEKFYFFEQEGYLVIYQLKIQSSSGELWKGYINSIKFRSKVTGKITVYFYANSN